MIKTNSKMNKLILILLLLIGSVFSANQKCTTDNHTKIFNEYAKNNKLGDLFQKNTYGGFLSEKCQNLGNNYRLNYIKLLDKHNITCLDKWCINGTFDCSGTRECNEVEHIVDRSNTPYNICNPNILGNVIMAYGKWNAQVGQLCWKDIINEKKQVYGKNIFCDAIRNVIECSGCNVELPPECLDRETSEHATHGKVRITLMVTGIISIIVVATTLCVCQIIKQRKTREIMLNMNMSNEDIEM